jgi:hypothetical protein
MRRTRADFVSRTSIIEWPDAAAEPMRCRVLSVTDLSDGEVIIKIKPDRAFSEPLELHLTKEDWVTVVGYSP